MAPRPPQSVSTQMSFTISRTSMPRPQNTLRTSFHPRHLPGPSPCLCAFPILLLTHQTHLPPASPQALSPSHPGFLAVSEHEGLFQPGVSALAAPSTWNALALHCSYHPLEEIPPHHRFFSMLYFSL